MRVSLPLTAIREAFQPCRLSSDHETRLDASPIDRDRHALHRPMGNAVAGRRLVRCQRHIVHGPEERPDAARRCTRRGHLRRTARRKCPPPRSAPQPVRAPAGRSDTGARQGQASLVASCRSSRCSTDKIDGGAERSHGQTKWGRPPCHRGHSVRGRAEYWTRVEGFTGTSGTQGKLNDTFGNSR